MLGNQVQRMSDLDSEFYSKELVVFFITAIFFIEEFSMQNLITTPFHWAIFLHNTLSGERHFNSEKNVVLGTNHCFFLMPESTGFIAAQIIEAKFPEGDSRTVH